MAVKQEFASRFAKHKDELEWLFMELYHNREGLEVLEQEMAEAYNVRSAELKALDKARSADPEWYKRGNMFGMTMYIDLFAGNLKELAKKLPYLKEQKLTYLHLMPLLQMPHPHWMFIDVIKDGKPTLVGVSTGLVVGLVAITPGAGFVPIWSAIIIGEIGRAHV